MIYNFFGLLKVDKALETGPFSVQNTLFTVFFVRGILRYL